MKTEEKYVVVGVLDGGRVKRINYPIVTRNGDLMTRRLRCVLTGKLSRSFGKFVNGRTDRIRFLGVIWEPPYNLLNEITNNRVLLQNELFMLEGESQLTTIPVITIPHEVNSDVITTLILYEIYIRKLVKARIHRLDKIKEQQAESLDYNAGGWASP